MTIFRAALIVSSAVAALAVATPASARHLRHHHHHHVHRIHVSLGIDYNHNYGPGLTPGTFAYYDGPLGLRCDQSAAAYRGQDGRPHPCN
jgi:hypothetical protein